MRLLDTTTKKLKTFYGDQTPKYAILSHMWGAEEDEVLFRHIAGSNADRREGRRRKGYAKIEGACKQAVEDGWKYIWIDTCCIDKASSTELSEAINSMYRWYWNSEVCYVYLADVCSGGDVQLESDKSATFPIVPFERSRWFSRGWTLQELIAPRYAVFYSKDWVDIGTKTGLRDTISAVTRIRVEMLTTYDPRQASIAEKMSWAAFRETTRAEDVAYCLMGLLGVNMPLLYGEGDRAFRRLQEEIMKVSDDDSLFAWKDCLDDYNYYPDNTQGMLAASPWYFRDGMDIAKSNNGAYSPYSMTSQGLEIKLPLLPIDPMRKLIGIDSKNIFKITLNCIIRDSKPTRWIAIYLKKIREGYYQRICSHWLDETETNPNRVQVDKLTSLLVPQIDVAITQKHPEIGEITLKIEILPTKCGFTTGDHSLVKGYNQVPSLLVHGTHKMFYFRRQEKCFGVIIGLDKGFPWLDFFDKEPTYGAYKEGSPRFHIPGQHLDQLSERVPGGDWWVTVSVRKMDYNQRGSCFRVIIDIQRVPFREKGRYIPSAMPASESFDGNFPGNLSHHNIHPDFKKEGRDWFAIFNPRVERVHDLSLLYTLQHKSLVYCVQFSLDGRYLATGSEMVRVYDMKTGVERYTFFDEPTAETARHANVYIHSICFSPDSKFLATGDSDGYVKAGILWDIDKKCIHKIFKCPKSPIDFLCFLLNNRLMISESKSGTIWILRTVGRTSRVLTICHGYNRRMSVAISPDCRLITAGSPSNIIRIWDIQTTNLLVELQGNEDYVCNAFTPDGKGIVSRGTNGTLKYWDISESTPPGSTFKGNYLNGPGAPSILAGRNLGEKNEHLRLMASTGHKDSVNSVAVSHNGDWVVSGSKDGSVLFWDLRNASAQFMLKTRSIHSLKMSLVGDMFATISDDGSIRVWGITKWVARQNSRTSDREENTYLKSSGNIIQGVIK